MSLENQVIDKIDEIYDIAEKAFNRSFPSPGIKFKKRGKVAGTANYGSNTLNFNIVLLRENTEQFINQTVPHECAHLIAHQVYDNEYRKIKPHGREWKTVMMLLGANPKRCHNYDTSNSTIYRKTRYIYKCNCREHVIGPTRHKRAQIGTRYYCKYCKQTLQFVSKERK